VVLATETGTWQHPCKGALQAKFRSFALKGSMDRCKDTEYPRGQSVFSTILITAVLFANQGLNYGDADTWMILDQG
jgi:hypothetical protein